MTTLKPHEQDKLRYLLNAFAASPPSVQAEALRQMIASRPVHLRAVK